MIDSMLHLNLFLVIAPTQLGDCTQLTNFALKVHDRTLVCLIDVNLHILESGFQF